MSTPQIKIPPDSAGDATNLNLEPTQQAGMLLAKGVGLVTTLVILLIVIDWIIKSPWLGAPSGLAEMDSKKAEAVVANLKAINDLAVERSVRIFDTVVARSLLPVFTAILGYIFGTRSVGK